jgi:two-component system, chemotaxis family, protein-glutamate methylesterase/glutaminase
LSAYELIAVGGSWGGLKAFGRLLEGLPEGFDTPLVVVQHRSADSSHEPLQRLWAKRTSLEVHEVLDKDPLRQGVVHVAPPDYHLIVEPGRLALSVDARVQYSRPSIDVTFETAAEAYGERLVAVLLSGANSDGAAGMRQVARRGGCTVAQDPSTAEQAAMPRAAIEAGAAEVVLPLDEIAPHLARLCDGERSAA